MLSLEFEDEQAERAAYLEARAEYIQSQIVTYRSAPAITSSSMVWTYRHTYCDVISVITTSQPIKNGSMKDIKYQESQSFK